jgi:hypothetical protein
MSIEHCRDLNCHPTSGRGTVRAIQVRVRRSANAEIRMTFRLDGDISRILVPSPAVPRIGRELWRHTCFEAFIAIDGQPAYHEFNFAPSGEWTVYALRGYRDGVPLGDVMMDPQIALRSNRDRLELDAQVKLDRVSAIHPVRPLRVGLAAVIETSDGLAYWALHHPLNKPDFHHADGFALLLEPPNAE